MSGELLKRYKMPGVNMLHNASWDLWTGWTNPKVRLRQKLDGTEGDGGGRCVNTKVGDQGAL